MKCMYCGKRDGNLDGCILGLTTMQTLRIHDRIVGSLCLDCCKHKVKYQNDSCSSCGEEDLLGNYCGNCGGSNLNE